VKPFIPREGVTADPVWVNGEQEWEVETVLNYHIIKPKGKHKRSVTEFLLKWKGNYEPSWQDIQDCENCVSTIEQYLAGCTKGVRSKIYRTFTDEEVQWLSPTFLKEARAAQGKK
jgi:hypothetical protein